MNKIVCNLSTEELRNAYIGEGKTLKEMCELVGAKSVITVSKILSSHGISTNNNRRLKEKTMHGMDENEFKAYLMKEYKSGRSMKNLGDEFNVSPSCIRKYLIKYGIQRRYKTDFFKGDPKKNPRYIGKEKIIKNGYYMIRYPEHPNAVNGFVYEHRLIVEKKLNRYLKKDEVVHHIDGNKLNNDLSNLLIMTNSEHAKLHGIIRRNKRLLERE